MRQPGRLTHSAVKFAVVGLAATALHLGVAWLLVSAGVRAQVANAEGFAAAVIFSFLGHTLFTFRSRVSLRRAALFLASGLLGLLTSHLVTSLALLGGLREHACIIAGAASVPFVTFAFNHKITYALHRSDRGKGST